MRFLYLTAQLPEPPHAGGTLRTNGLLRGVHAAGHEVHILSFATPEALVRNRAALDEFCTSIDVVHPPHRSLIYRLRDLLLTRAADMQGRFASALYEERLRVVLSQTPFDLIQIESLEMAIYLPIVKQMQPQTPVIYDSFNAEYDLQHTIFQIDRRNPRRIAGAVYSFIQWRRLTHFERHVCETVDHVIAVSEADAEAFHRLAPGSPVSVVPNGIYTAPYAHTDSSLNLDRCALVFTGSMNYRPNVDAALWFVEHILDKVRVRVPEAKFFVVGSQPHARLDSLRQRPDVEITGWVPEVKPFLHAAAVYVVPLRMGSGTRLKLLQAMAAGCAVVSTTIGAQGLQVHHGRELLLADSANAFAEAVIKLLENPSERDFLGQAGANYVKMYHDWSAIVPKLLIVYQQVTGNSNTGE